MAQTFDDRVAAEVNKRLAEASAAAGVDAGRVALEVLYLLPPEFVRKYRELFDRALSDPVKPSSDGGRDEGRLRATGRPTDAMKTRSMGGAAPGKRFVAGAWPIRDEVALEEKRKLDKKLILAVTKAIAVVKAAKSPLGAPGYEDETILLQCAECGRFLQREWLRCPFHTPA